MNTIKDALKTLVVLAMLAGLIYASFWFWRLNHPDAAWWAWLLHK